jgi:hypothetical protein
MGAWRRLASTPRLKRQNNGTSTPFAPRTNYTSYNEELTKEEPMVSYKRAFLAVVVSSIATQQLSKLGFKAVMETVNETFKEACDKAFQDGFDAGWNGALSDSYLVSRTFMKNAKNMEMN